MLPIETMLLFFGVSSVLALTPGPDNLFVLMQSALYGYKRGVAVALGLCSGLIFHTAAVTLGATALIKTSPLAFNLLKMLGAAYLCYLAVQAFRAGRSRVETHRGGLRPGYRQLYFRGVIMNSSNPKVAIFFLAFLPQFADPNRDDFSLQLIFLGLLFMLATILVFSSMAYFAGYIGEKIQTSANIQGHLNTIAGVIFILLALRLLFTRI